MMDVIGLILSLLGLISACTAGVMFGITVMRAEEIYEKDVKLFKRMWTISTALAVLGLLLSTVSLSFMK